MTTSTDSDLVAMYRDIYSSSEDRWRNYGRSMHGRHWARAIVAYVPDGATIVDVGCGRNDWARLVRSEAASLGRDVRVIGQDPACNDADTQDPACDVIARERPYMVTAWDVLEHLTEDGIREILHAAREVGAELCATVSTKLALHNHNGRNLHETVRQIEWWRGQVRGLWDGAALRECLHTVAITTVPEIEPTVILVDAPANDHVARVAESETGDLMVRVDHDGYLAVREWAARLYPWVTIECRTRRQELRDAAQLARSDVITLAETDSTSRRNREVNALRCRLSGTDQTYHSWMGYDVVIVGAGPSLADEIDGLDRWDSVDGLTRWVDSGERRVLLCTDRAASVDPTAPWITIEPRPVKLQQHPGRCIAHIGSYPDRCPDDRTTWLRQALSDDVEVPGWVAEVPGARHVTALAVWYAWLCRARRVILVGCDYCYQGGRAYHAHDEDQDGLHVEVRCVDGETRETRADWASNLAEMRAIGRLFAETREDAYAPDLIQVGRRVARIEGWDHYDTLDEVTRG
jgi:hypothetical protein